MTYPVTDIANYFIDRVNSDTESGDNITNLKLQKLVYYAQGFHLAWYGEPLFPEPIEHWMHGPVVRDLYNKYSRYVAAPLPTDDAFDPAMFDERTKDLLEQVYEVYGQYSASGLRNLTHQERPWTETVDFQEIPIALMREFFLETLTIA